MIIKTTLLQTTPTSISSMSFNAAQQVHNEDSVFNHATLVHRGQSSSEHDEQLREIPAILNSSQPSSIRVDTTCCT